MKKGQGLVVGLLILIAAMLGVVIALLVRPSVEEVVRSNVVDQNAVEDEVTTAPDESASPASDVNPIDAIVDNVISEEAGVQKPTEVKVPTIPRIFQGTWSEQPELCGRDRLEQGMVRISASRVEFPETSGQVKQVLLRGAGAMEVDAQFADGLARTAYSLDADRQQILVEAGDGAGTRYRRCPDA